MLSVLLVEETRVPGEKPPTYRKLHDIVSSTHRLIDRQNGQSENMIISVKPVLCDLPREH